MPIGEGVPSEVAQPRHDLPKGYEAKRAENHAKSHSLWTPHVSPAS